MFVCSTSPNELFHHWTDQNHIYVSRHVRRTISSSNICLISCNVLCSVFVSPYCLLHIDSGRLLVSLDVFTCFVLFHYCRVYPHRSRLVSYSVSCISSSVSDIAACCVSAGFARVDSEKPLLSVINVTTNHRVDVETVHTQFSSSHARLKPVVEPSGTKRWLCGFLVKLWRI